MTINLYNFQAKSQHQQQQGNPAPTNSQLARGISIGNCNVAASRSPKPNSQAPQQPNKPTYSNSFANINNQSTQPLNSMPPHSSIPTPNQATSIGRPDRLPSISSAKPTQPNRAHGQMHESKTPSILNKSNQPNASSSSVSRQPVSKESLERSQRLRELQKQQQQQMQHQKTGGGHENPNGIRRGVSSNNRPMQQRSADHHALVGQSNIGTFNS